MLLKFLSIPPDVEIQRKLTSTRIDEWIRDDIFRFRWWFLIALFIVAVVLWWKMVDKTRLLEISLYASLTTIIALGLDEIGDEFCLWYYPTDIIPVFPPLTSVDLACLPFIYSITYQHFKTWKSFLFATLVMSAIFCFILEPILVWGGFYQPLKWKYYYGFPIYTIIALCIRLAVVKSISIVKKSKEQT